MVMSTILIPGKVATGQAIGTCSDCGAVFKAEFKSIARGAASHEKVGVASCPTKDCYGDANMYYLDCEKGIELLEMVRKYEESKNHG